MKPHISIIFGGASFEHEISIVSAISLKKILGAQVSHFIFLDHLHKLYLIPSEQMQAKTFATGAYKQCKQLEFTLGGFAMRGLFGAKILHNLGVLLSLIHGGDGEDGRLSGVLEFYQIPFIAPRITACALSVDKILTKIYAKEKGVKVLPYESFKKGENLANADSGALDSGAGEYAGVKISFPYPFIIKPAKLGSSIGVSVVEKEADLEYALDSAFGYDKEILVEPFYKGVKEYNLAGYKNAQGEIVFSMVEEPQKSALLSFDDKYLDFSRTAQVARADISSELESKLKNAFCAIYGTLFEGALIRCDFFVIDDEVYLNEINPIPGSMANYLFADFAGELANLAHALPKPQVIKPSYHYVEKIRQAKGK
ncbi:D-alanine--D-alanine ligase A [Helicobacter sp. CLO-3]|uniref:D-alanine--D-alanine ligase n=1 Tax=unclassified Helicobacter TaxID=2593540 RepID=UPI00080580DD|nr:MULTISPECIES: D-alanine--D-alanine ligase [unclassified Helicobacter]OBV29181.1 D-alanine--D-alanine ligase A [Helicobacter sp. CLO-3]OHU84012.1 D-alanine--D-alanine ligase A [Helicobacter sp. CLO-3]